MKNKRGSAWIWILIILILVVVGVIIYVVINGGGGEAGGLFGPKIPTPPPLPE